MPRRKLTEQTQGDETIDVVEIAMGRAEFCVIGTTPLIQNRMSEKARQQLLFPPPPRNRAERQATLKHDPTAEFRSSMYRSLNDAKPVARLHVPTGAFSRALAAAARDIPGATKAQMDRLTSVADVNISLYGVPQLFMAVVRQAGIAKTPDIRTRAILPRWACRVTVEFVRPLLTERTVVNLFAAAGVIVGVGDDRPEKGGAHGKFRLCAQDDPEFVHLLKNEARVAQDEAIANPTCYDAESDELFGWFQHEVVRREKVRAVDTDDVALSNGRKVRRRRGEVEARP